MQERNKYLESGGLVLDNGKFEWFAEKGVTEYAQKENLAGISLPNIHAYVIRNKENGHYSRVLVDHSSQDVIYETDGLEDIGFKIDQLKLIKQAEQQDKED